MLAAYMGYEEICQYLIDLGFDPNARFFIYLFLFRCSEKVIHKTKEGKNKERE